MREMKSSQNSLHAVFLCVGISLLSLGLLGALASHKYLGTHKTFVVFRVFLVRDVNGALIKKDIQFYIRGRRQQCTPGLYWP